MITDESLLKAIGKLALAYSALEERIEWCVSHLLHCDDPDIGSHIAGRFHFGSRLELLEWLIGHYRRTYFLSESKNGLALNQDIASIKQLAVIRNDIIHGYLQTTHPGGRAIAFWNKKRFQRAEPDEIEGVAEKMESIGRAMDDSLWAFSAEIHRMNQPRRPPNVDGEA